MMFAGVGLIISIKGWTLLVSSCWSRKDTILFDLSLPGSFSMKVSRFPVFRYSTSSVVVRQCCSSFALWHKRDSIDNKAELQTAPVSNIEKRRPDWGSDSKRDAVTAQYFEKAASFRQRMITARSKRVSQFARVQSAQLCYLECIFIFDKLNAVYCKRIQYICLNLSSTVYCCSSWYFYQKRCCTVYTANITRRYND